MDQPYYIRDISENILGQVDTNGTVVLKYTHDAYGNLLEVSGILKDSLGKENPFLYKGYYYIRDTIMILRRDYIIVTQDTTILNGVDG